MAEAKPCQRPGCDQLGKPHTITDSARRKKVKLHLCDTDYDVARETKHPPIWLRELLTHIGLVG